MHFLARCLRIGLPNRELLRHLAEMCRTSVVRPFVFPHRLGSVNGQQGQAYPPQASGLLLPRPQSPIDQQALIGRQIVARISVQRRLSDGALPRSGSGTCGDSPKHMQLCQPVIGSSEPPVLSPTKTPNAWH